VLSTRRRAPETRSGGLLRKPASSSFRFEGAVRGSGFPEVTVFPARDQSCSSGSDAPGEIGEAGVARHPS